MVSWSSAFNATFDAGKRGVSVGFWLCCELCDEVLDAVPTVFPVETGVPGTVDCPELESDAETEFADEPEAAAAEVNAVVIAAWEFSPGTSWLHAATSRANAVRTTFKLECSRRKRLTKVVSGYGKVQKHCAWLHPSFRNFLTISLISSKVTMILACSNVAF